MMAHHRVSPDFFEVLGIPVVRGRTFDSSDRTGTPLVAVVDQQFVTEFMGGENVIGQIVRYPWRGAPPIEIVGIVATVFHGDLASSPQPTMWVPLAQMGMGAVGHVTAVGLASGQVDAALGALMRGSRDQDDRIAVSNMATYEQLLSESLSSTRLLTLLLLLFAGTTLVLGCVGVYGVASYTVRTQLREIGVRMALGAPAVSIRARVLRDGLRLALPGGLVGLVLAVPAARALDGVLFGVETFDPATFLAAPAILAFAALAAVYLPARRATRVDPATILRED
jgi:ABC-type antimicrobial peptide transport system permease subunit